MDVREIIAFLNRVYVWIPYNNPMRTELQQMIQKLKSMVPR